MGTSSILGGQRAPVEAPGRDAGALGPSDSSDSGSDLAGSEREAGDPNEPVDVALQGDAARPPGGDLLDGGAATDRSGTGERRSAGSDAGARDAPDISTDRVVDLHAPGSVEAVDDDEDPDLAFMDDDEPEPGAANEDESDAEAVAPPRDNEPRRPGDPQRTKTS